MKFFQSLLLIFLLGNLNFDIKAQRCGFTLLTIYLTDFKGEIIKDAEIKTFDKDFEQENHLDYFRNPGISWNEKKRAYFGMEGMCGGHIGVGLRISAEGFETFDRIINLPLGFTSYSIKLKRKETNEVSEIISLSPIKVRIYDENKAIISSADIEIIDAEGKKYYLRSNEMEIFEIDLPIGSFTIQISKVGFRNLKLINFQIENTDTIYLDLMLKIRGCDDCKGDILGENKGEDRKEVILDYQTIKRKNNK